MYISECLQDREVTVHLQKGDKAGNFELKPKALSGMDEQLVRRMFEKREFLLALEPLRIKGKVVNLSAPGMKYDVAQVVNREVHCWKGVRLLQQKLSGPNSVVLCYSDHNSIRIDRRRGDRIPVGGDGEIVAMGKTLRRVFVRDVSLGGVGILMPKNGTLAKGSEFRLEWSEKVRGRGGESLRTLKVPVRVVRVTPFDQNRNVVGCRMIQYSQQEVSQYLQDKKRTLGM